MAARVVSPISVAEFAMMMREATPPSGWNNILAVGNSGGPDSTCLLFLLNRYFKAEPTRQSFERLVSLSIDHDLQASSASMAAQASETAQLLGVEHITTKLAWGKGYHTAKPGPNDTIEEKARDMRQLVLLEEMKKLDANTIAFGHHADDQVETMLMRLGRKSSPMGLAGMRPCRRWGMGSEREASSLHAIEGMRKWIVRPLLGVGKERIMATCEEQKLNYVTDSTNFQPQLTIRNAVRHVIQKGGISAIAVDSLPRNISQSLHEIHSAASEVTGQRLGLDSSLQDLQAIHKNMVIARSNTDKTVDELVAKYQIPSPPGTIMISPSSLRAIESQTVKEALLYRITRYVSPEPWGHPKAELGRRKSSVNRLLAYVCDGGSVSTRNNRSVCVGSSVWWRLAYLSNDRLSFDLKSLRPAQLVCIAMRQPPERSHQDLEANMPDILTPDLTNEIIRYSPKWSTNRNASPVMEFLYDYRFLMCFHMDKIPEEILKSLTTGTGKIIVKPTKTWTTPQIIHREDHTTSVLHTAVMNENSTFHHHQVGSRKPQKDIYSDWISVHYCRPLSSV